jgi:hypothetical protein
MHLFPFRRRLEADNDALKSELDKVHTSVVSEKLPLQKELQKLQHELATVQHTP